MSTATRRGFRDAMVATVASERERQGLSRRALCDLADLSPTVLQHFEKNGRDLYMGTLSQIAKALRVPMWRLVRDAEDYALALAHADALENGT